jgi:diguanylate cyclase (GGDEF)-like protein/hemerythrin-like metal-binding protein/PAS domain S-box-containing protein
MDSDFKKLSNSPLGVIVKVVLLILGGEFSIMLAIDGVLSPFFGATVPSFFWEFIDPIVLCIIVAPALHVLVLRPMQAQQAKLLEQKDELGIAAVTFDAQDGVIVTDEKHVILRVNRSFTAITGYGAGDVIGKTPKVLQSGRHDKEFYRRMRASLADKSFWQGEIWNRRKSGEIYPEWLTITVVKSETGNIHYVGVFSDISKRKAYEEKISYMAFHDKLTGLPSRELFYDRLSLAMSRVRRKQDRLALLFVDLDGFKEVNDNFGHEIGDEVLRVTASRLAECVREEDTAARVGGDEFAVVVNGIENPGDAILVAEKIISSLSAPIRLGAGQECGIGASIGIAVYPENGVEIDRLLSAADSAMYAAKANGKNTYTLSRVQAHWDTESNNWVVLDSAHLFGVPEMDQEHLDLSTTLNELNAAVMGNQPPEVTTQLLGKLSMQIQVHFANEERLMDQYGYFDSDISRSNVHKHEHRRLADELDMLAEKFMHGGEMAVLHELKEWLLNHISTFDRQLGELISQNRGK